MKKIVFLLTSLIISFSIPIKAQKKQEYLLSCQFKGLPDKSKVYLRTQEKDTIQKTISEGNRVIFRGSLNPEGRFLFIRFDSLISNVSTKAIFVVNNNIQILGTVGQRDIMVRGSAGQQEYIDELKYVDSLDNIFAPKMKKADTEIADRLKVLIADLNNKKIDSTTFDLKSKDIVNVVYTIRNNYEEALFEGLKRLPASSMFAPYSLMNRLRSSNISRIQKLYDRLNPNARASYYGLELRKELESLKLAGLIKPGAVIPDFNVSSVNQRKFSVLEYAKKGKITLIDFWASWCKPCRAETPNMKKVYEAFHDKGFNIIGISTDAKEIDWKKALMEDNTPWFHGWDNLDKATTSVFSIGAIPAFALVDGDGKLIAFSCGMSNIPSFGPDIRGEGLYKTIETLVKERSK